jgi:hypothetical protein
MRYTTHVTFIVFSVFTSSRTDMVCVHLVSPFTKRTQSAFTQNYKSRKSIQASSKFLKKQICQVHPSRISFITPVLHMTRKLKLSSLIMGVWVSSNVSSKKFMTIKALNSKQLQIILFMLKQL